jgi:hypothetical protein
MDKTYQHLSLTERIDLYRMRAEGKSMHVIRLLEAPWSRFDVDQSGTIGAWMASVVPRWDIAKGQETQIQIARRSESQGPARSRHSQPP